MFGGTFIGNAFNGCFWEAFDQELLPADIQGGSPRSMLKPPGRRAEQATTRVHYPTRRI